ncbi:MAG: YaaL family protein [Clostridiaceae bacterium]|nr:YaaL family protein [Clostridiaceae bacterium]
MHPNATKKEILLYDRAKKRLVKILKKAEKAISYFKSNKNLRNIGPYTVTEEDDMLIENIRSARNEWLNANSNLQHVCENEIIDYYTYLLKAAQVKYEYFLKKAKEKGVKLKLGIQSADSENAQFGK